MYMKFLKQKTNGYATLDFKKLKETQKGAKKKVIKS